MAHHTHVDYTLVSCSEPVPEHYYPDGMPPRVVDCRPSNAARKIAARLAMPMGETYFIEVRTWRKTYAYMVTMGERGRGDNPEVAEPLISATRMPRDGFRYKARYQLNVDYQPTIVDTFQKNI